MVDSVSRSRQSLRNELRREGIDEPVLEALFSVPRERFLPANLQQRAYENVALPIGEGQTISQPYIVALMTQALNLTGRERVLEVGTGSGYQTAILSMLAREVVTIERHPELSASAEKTLRELNLTHVSFVIGDGSTGIADKAPFDRIVVTAGAPRLPKKLLEQLGSDGIMVIPIGSEGKQLLHRIKKIDGKYRRSILCGCRFVPLIGAAGWDDDAQSELQDE